MARPKKNNADYFSHDADMRNDPKIKALRRKFGFMGYAVWNLLLEVLTDSDFFTYEWSDLNIELLAGDFDCEPEQLTDVVNYCVQLKLLSISESGDLTCNRLIERFEGLLSKRKRDRSRVIAGENPQSKVKESKVNNSISIYDFSKQQIERQEKGEQVDEFLLAVSHIYKLIHSVHGEILLDSLEFIQPLRKLVEDKKITDYREMWYACEWAMKDDFWQDVITSSSAFAKNYHQLVIKMRKK